MNNTPLLANGLYGVVFDCDGVLVDSRSANIGYYNLLLHELGKHPLTKVQEDYAQMATAHQAIAQVLTTEELDCLPELYQRHPYQNVSLPHLQLEPGLKSLLMYLQKQDIRLGIFTNRGRGVYDVLKMFDLQHFFDIVMCVDDVEPKPNPEGLLNILRHWRVAPDEIVFVGDSVTDEGAAHAAGVPLAAYKNTMLKGAWHVDSFVALQTVFAEYLDSSTTKKGTQPA